MADLHLGKGLWVVEELGGLWEGALVRLDNGQRGVVFAAEGGGQHVVSERWFIYHHLEHVQGLRLDDPDKLAPRALRQRAAKLWCGQPGMYYNWDTIEEAIHAWFKEALRPHPDAEPEGEIPGFDLLTTEGLVEATKLAVRMRRVARVVGCPVGDTGVPLWTSHVIDRSDRSDAGDMPIWREWTLVPIVNPLHYRRFAPRDAQHHGSGDTSYVPQMGAGVSVAPFEALAAIENELGLGW